MIRNNVLLVLCLVLVYGLAFAFGLTWWQALIVGGTAYAAGVLAERRII